MSDTGGGHRASMNAIIAALKERYGVEEHYGVDRFVFDHVDVYRQMGYPANKMPEFYPWIIENARWLWTLSYRIGDGVRRSRFLAWLSYIANRGRLRRMVQEHPADVVVSVHSIISRPSMHAYESLGERPPFITVVTDLVSTPLYWYDPRVERCLVPTQQAYERGLWCGLKPEQMKITGLPVHPDFQRKLIDKAEARKLLGWDAELPAILIVGGSDGMGPLYETARAINDLNLTCQIAVVAGKNDRLESRLKSSTWNQPTHIYPFIDYMPRLMAAADVLVTKAGPSSICEACIAGLPVILYDAIPGQEDGNVAFVIENDIGVFARQPQQVAATVAAWLDAGDEALRARAERALALAKPDAVYTIADEIMAYVGGSY